MAAVRQTVDYCAYGFQYRKSTDIWTSLTHWSPEGATGSGRCELSCGQGKWQLNDFGRLTFRHHINLAQHRNKFALPVDEVNHSDPEAFRDMQIYEDRMFGVKDFHVINSQRDLKQKSVYCFREPVAEEEMANTIQWGKYYATEPPSLPSGDRAVLEVRVQGMQDQGTNLKQAKTAVLQTREFLPNMNPKRGAGKVCVGYCAQPGIRHRFEEGEESEREKIDQAELLTSKRDEASRHRYGSLLHNLQPVVNSVYQAAMPWMKPMLRESSEWQKVYLPECGTISDVHPSATLGL